MSVVPRISVVIVAHDMPRQIVRTVRSLSPGMQSGVRAGEYELIVVDNGSQRPIDRGACESFGAALRWLSIEDAPPSPARALNMGIAAARAPLIGAMIDGARMASPGVLEHALLAARLHERAVIGTLGFHLGDQLQQRSVRSGYDETAEEALLAEVDWAEDGYRLFDVSVPGVSSKDGWFATPAESNAIFMPAVIWGELGGYDERFATPGGGLVNLDLFARACALPSTRLIVLLGEGTFHQVHGGVTTNEPMLRFAELDMEYKRLRGRSYRRPDVRPVCVGSPCESALAVFEGGLP